MLLLFASRRFMSSIGRMILMVAVPFFFYSWISGVSLSWWSFNNPVADVATTSDSVGMTLSGKGKAHTSDSLIVNRRLVRLWGMDAMEYNQGCAHEGERTHQCGKVAKRILIRALAQGPVICTVRDHDAWDRAIATCSVKGVDLGGLLVREGYALSTPEGGGPYAQEEASAKATSTGIWAGHFMQPWNVRAASAPF